MRSKTTAGDDLGDKFAAYRCIETLAEYLTRDSRKRAVQLAAGKTEHPMAADPDRLSFAQFLAREERQEGRFEFSDGEVVARSGGTGDHTRIADNFRNRLNHHFGAGSPCYAYGSDRKIRVPRPTGDCARYPDATVTCAENDHGKAFIIASPVVILEVVSDSSISIDAIKKPRQYTALPTLMQYLLVDSRECWALSYIRRNAAWDADCCKDEIVTIPHFGLRLSFAKLYAGTTLDVRQRSGIEGVSSSPTPPPAPHQPMKAERGTKWLS